MRALILAALAVLLLSGCSGVYSAKEFQDGYNGTNPGYGSFKHKQIGASVEEGLVVIETVHRRKDATFTSPTIRSPWTTHGYSVGFEPHSGLASVEQYVYTPQNVPIPGISGFALKKAVWRGEEEQVVRLHSSEITAALAALVNSPDLANEYFKNPGNKKLAAQVAQLADFRAALDVLEEEGVCGRSLTRPGIVVLGDDESVLLMQRFVSALAAIGVDTGLIEGCTEGVVSNYARLVGEKDDLKKRRGLEAFRAAGQFINVSFPVREALDGHLFPLRHSEKITALSEFATAGEAEFLAQQKHNEKQRRKLEKRRKEHVQQELAPTAEEKKFGKF